MEIKTHGIVRGGRLTVDVDVPDGTRVDVIIRRPSEAEILHETDRFREETQGTGVGQRTIKEWAREGLA